MLGRLLSRTPPATESLDPSILGNIVNAPFPRSGQNRDYVILTWYVIFTWIRIPFPNGIPGRILVMTTNVLHSDITTLFDACFPENMENSDISSDPKARKKELRGASIFLSFHLSN